MPSGRWPGEGALLFFEPGHVGVAEQGDAVGSEGEDLVDGVGESLGGLVGQAVDQVDVDAVEAEVAGGWRSGRASFRRVGCDGWFSALRDENPECPCSGG